MGDFDDITILNVAIAVEIYSLAHRFFSDHVVYFVQNCIKRSILPVHSCPSFFNVSQVCLPEENNPGVNQESVHVHVCLIVIGLSLHISLSVGLRIL